MRGGGVARLCAHWFDLGRAVPCYLPDTFDDLHRRTPVALADLDGSTLRRTVLTHSGYLRYAELTKKRGVPPDPPAGRIAPGRSGQCLARPLPDHRNSAGDACSGRHSVPNSKARGCMQLCQATGFAGSSSQTD